uniref:Chlororespiratory reduction 4 n=1 Tax=Quercus lobata TaxID=97700 RepID=A0A7N2LB22_QUELO
MAYARRVFDQIPDPPNIALWNAMFKGYAQNESYREVLVLFSNMKSLDVMPNCFTFPLVLKSCGKINAYLEGQEVQCVAIKGGFRADPFVGTTLIDMYAGGGAVREAYKVFGEMVERNVVAWTSMISGYILCRDMVSARRLFDLAPERDVVLWNTMVSGYIELGDMVAARKLFDEMPNRDVMSWNTVLNGYANNGDVEACERLFEEMPERNIFSWNGLIGGYAQNGKFFEVMETFKRMLIEGNVLPNDVTLVIALSACSRLGAPDLENAVDVFKSMARKDLITWNTIINGIAMHGHGSDALNLFCEMKNAGETPDGITLIGILSACTHMGLVEDGFSYFQSMVDDYSIVPQIKHYGCMVDLFARAGLLEQAIEFVRKMPMEADAVIWAALLGACRIYKNTELAEVAFDQLIKLEPKNPSNFVMLSNIYGDLGRWKDVARLKVSMRDTGLRKLPGCSLIEVNDSVVEFYSLDERHSEREEIYRALRGLTKSLRSFEYLPDLMELEQGG